MGFIGDHTDGDGDARTRPARDARRPSRSEAAGGARAARAGAAALVPAEIPRVRLRRGAGDDRRETGEDAGRAGPGAGARALARRVGAARARQRLPLRHRLPDGEAAVLHPPRTRRARRSSNSFDLLFRGLELVTGGQRLHRYEDYLRRAGGPRGIDPAPFAGYLEAFRARHAAARRLRASGWSAGWRAWSGAANVRETTLFPRDLQRLTP